MNLDGRHFQVSATDSVGVVSSETQIEFTQRGERVLGRYTGGTITRGMLVGEMHDDSLTFRYAQRELDGAIHTGRSRCDLQERPDGRLTIFEHFTWETRVGSGTNTFVETEP